MIVVLPILSFYITPSGMADVAKFTAFIAVITIFCGWNVQGIIGRQFGKLNINDFNVFVYNALLVILVSTILVLIIIVLFQTTLAALLGIKELYLLLGVIAAGSRSVISTNLVIRQFSKSPISYGLFEVFSNILTVSAILILVVGMELEEDGRILAQILSTIFISIVGLRYLIKKEYIHLSIDFLYLKQMIDFGLSLIPHKLANWVVGGFTLLLISNYMQPNELGLYATAVQFSIVLMALFDAVNNAVTPHLYDFLNNKYKKNSFIYFSFINLLFIGFATLAVAYLSEILLSAFFHIDYANSIKYFIYVFPVSFLYGVSLLYMNYFVYFKDTKHMSKITFTTSLIYIFAAVFLIESYGVEVILVLLIVTHIVKNIFMAYRINREFIK